jgi:hypothetical protein
MGQPKKCLVNVNTWTVCEVNLQCTIQQLTDIDYVVDIIKSRVIKAIETDSLLGVK